MRLYTIINKIVDLLNNQHPVGCLYFSMEPTSPENFFIGKWERLSGRYILAAGECLSNTKNDYGECAAGAVNVAAKEMGGSPDAIVVKHNHDQEAHTHKQMSHNHDQNSHNHNQNSHSHAPGASERFLSYKGTRSTENISTISGTGYKISKISGAGSEWSSSAKTAGTAATNIAATATNKAATAENEETTAKNKEFGVSGDGRNMPPYIAVYVWHRVA